MERSSGCHWVTAAIAAGTLAVAAAIGFDDAELTPYQLELARLLVSVAGGGGFIFSALRYVWERQRELAWQKTSFMVELFTNFEKDETLRRAQELVDRSRYDDTRLRQALRPLDELYAAAEAPSSRWRPTSATTDADRGFAIGLP